MAPIYPTQWKVHLPLPLRPIGLLLITFNLCTPLHRPDRTYNRGLDIDLEMNTCYALVSLLDSYTMSHIQFHLDEFIYIYIYICIYTI